MTKKKIVKKIYQFLRLKLKRNLGNIRLIRRLKRKHVKRVSELNKKKFNFVLVDDFIRENSCGKIYENVDGYDINLYELDNAYISNCLNCAFVQKISNDELYTFKESAGVIARLDEPCMNYAPPFDLKNITPIEEDEVCLLCYLLGENYWHYIFDIIPRLMIMIKRGYKGKFLVNNTWCARQFMELLKIPTDRLIINQYGLVIKAKKVYLYSEMYGIELSGSLLSDTRNYLISEVEKNYGKLEDKTFPKRIYVSRVARRKIINEAEIIELLEDKGFKVVIPEKNSVYEQMKYFYNAEIIVTPHGANCANLLFAQEGVSMVECFGHMWINPCMINTVGLLNIDYNMICERLADYKDDAHKFSDYIINPYIMENKIKKIIEYRVLAYDEDYLIPNEN